MKKQFTTLFCTLFTLLCFFLAGCLPQDLKQKVDVNINGAGDLTVSEGGQKAFLTLYLSTAPNADVVFDIETSDSSELLVGSEALHKDERFEKISLTFTNTTWFNPQRITIYGFDDNIIDGTQIASVVIRPAVSDDDRFDGLDPRDFPVSVEDNDLAGVKFEVVKAGGSTLSSEYEEVRNVTTSENSPGLTGSNNVEGNVTLFVSLRSRPASDVEFDLLTTLPSEALISNETNDGLVNRRKIKFTPETWDVRQSVIIAGQDDNLVDGSVRYSLFTSPFTTTDEKYKEANPQDITGINEDNDIAAFTVDAIHPLVVQALTNKSAQFSVALDAQPGNAVSIDISTNNSAIGQLVDPDNPGLTVDEITLEFVPDEWNVAQTVTVKGVSNEPQLNETPFFVNIGPAKSIDINFRNLRNLDIELFELGNVPGVFFYPKRNLISGEDNRLAEFYASLTTPPTDVVNLTLNSKNPDEGDLFVDNTGGDGKNIVSLQFDQNNWNTPRKVIVKGRDDSNIDDEQPVNVSPQVTSDDLSYNALTFEDVLVRNVDNDTLGFTILDPPRFLTSDSGEMSYIGVMLNTQPTANVVVDVSVSSSAEAQVTTDFSKNYSFKVRLIFGVSNWSVPQYVYITGVSDQLDDGNKKYKIVVDVDKTGTKDTSGYLNVKRRDIDFTSIDDDN